MNIKTTLLGAAAATGIIAGTLGVATQAAAQEPGADSTPTAERQSARGNFLARVAEKLGISAEQLQQAIRDAANDTVDEALANGRITQEQADKAHERINSGKGLRGFFERRHDRREHRRDLVRHAIVQSSATALNMTVEELRAELQAGNSIADVANEQGVSLDTVKAQITSDAEAKLDELVANGKLTQEKADEALAKLTENLDDILNKSKQPAASQ
ncbi:MAG: hypothetical protein HY873_10750 [Chloroflexi bacterium]|nr:hypothetical protein [Chloroflexota bacterium]